jgi:hypothetical protein
MATSAKLLDIIAIDLVTGTPSILRRFAGLLNSPVATMAAFAAQLRHSAQR